MKLILLGLILLVSASSLTSTEWACLAHRCIENCSTSTNSYDSDSILYSNCSACADGYTLIQYSSAIFLDHDGLHPNHRRLQ